MTCPERTFSASTPARTHVMPACRRRITSMSTRSRHASRADLGRSPLGERAGPPTPASFPRPSPRQLVPSRPGSRSLVSELAARTTPGPHAQLPSPAETPDPSETGSAVDSAYAELARTRKENADLKEALRTRTVIGQATGWLMAILDLDPDEAFAELVKRSSYANRKVRDIAVEIVAASTTATATA